MSGLVWASCPEGYRENDRTGECKAIPGLKGKVEAEKEAERKEQELKKAMASVAPGKFMKGITFGALVWPEKNLKWVDYNLDRLKTIGVDSIILAPDWYLDDYTDPTIEPWYRHKKGFPDTSWFSPTLYDREVKQIIRKAQARGFRVLLKPHVDTLDSPFGGIGRWGLRPAGNDWDTVGLVGP